MINNKVFYCIILNYKIAHYGQFKENHKNYKKQSKSNANIFKKSRKKYRPHSLTFPLHKPRVQLFRADPKLCRFP